MEPLLALRSGSHKTLRRRASQRSPHCNEFFSSTSLPERYAHVCRAHAHAHTSPRPAPARTLLRTARTCLGTSARCSHSHGPRNPPGFAQCLSRGGHSSIVQSHGYKRACTREKERRKGKRIKRQGERERGEKEREMGEGVPPLHIFEPSVAVQAERSTKTSGSSAHILFEPLVWLCESIS